MRTNKTTMACQETVLAAANSTAVAENPNFIHQLTRQRLLSADEEIRLAIRSREGDADAKDRLVEANMRLVINIAKHYYSTLVPFEDLVQEGAIGLMTATERFDPSKGYRFSTYATHWIKQSISRALDNKARAIRVPAHVSETLRKIERVRIAFIRETSEEPTIEQISEKMEMPPGKVAAFILAGQDPISLDMLVGDEENTSLASLINDKSAADPQESVIRREIRDELMQILETLTARERKVMTMRLGFAGDDQHVLQDIGEKLHISRERVRQIEGQAIKRLRSLARRNQLRDYLTE